MKKGFLRQTWGCQEESLKLLPSLCPFPCGACALMSCVSCELVDAFQILFSFHNLLLLSPKAAWDAVRDV